MSQPDGAQLLGSHDGRGALRTDEQPVAARGQPHRLQHLVVARVNRRALAFGQRLQHEEIAKRLGHAQAGGQCLRAFPERRIGAVRRKGGDQRRAARGLHDDEANRLRLDPADLHQLLEGLPDADDADPAAGRVDDHIGQAPAELFRDLQPHRLLALDAIRLFQRRGVEPAVLFDALRDELAGVGDEAIDQRQVRTIDAALQLVDLRGILRHGDAQVNARLRAVGRPSAARVARGWHGHVQDAEFLSARNAGAGAARFERTARVEPFIFYEQLLQPQLRAKFAGVQHGRKALPQRHDVGVVLHRQQLPVAPHIPSARRHGRLRPVPAGLVEPVVDEQRRRAVCAQVLFSRGVVPRVAFWALKV